MSIPSLSFIKEKWLHAGFQRYLKNTGWMFFGRFVTLGISFFIGIYIARYLGPANYGLLNYAMSFVGLFGFLTSFGIEGIVSREIIKDHAKKDELIGTSFYIKIAGSLLAILSVFIVSIFTTKDLFTLGLIWIFSLSFIPQAFGIIEVYFQSQVLSRKTVSAQIISNVVSAILKVVCIFLDKGIFWLTLIFLVEALVYSGIILFSFRKFGNHIRRWKFNINIAKTLLKDSWPLMLSFVAIGIYMKIDQVMIKNMLGNEQAGVYAVAVRLSEVFYFIPAIVGTSLFPSLVISMETSKELFESRIKRLYFFLFWISFCIALFTSVFAYPIVKILFGLNYIGSVTTLQIYSWSSVAVFLSYPLNQYLITKNLTKISFYNTLIGSLVNIILNIILIPKIGIVGAAIATLVSYTVATCGVFIFEKTRKQGMLMLLSIINFR